MNPKTENRRPKTKILRRAILFAPVVWLVLAWLAAAGLVVEKSLPEADAIFVFSGSAAVVERTSKAAALFHERRGGKIVLTNDGFQGGWSRAERRNLFHWEAAQRELTKRGVPAESIEVLPQQVFGTHDEAVLLAETARARGWSSVLLVTSDYHSRRALWMTERALIENDTRIAVGVESPAEPKTSLSIFWWLSPNGWIMVGGEYLKFAYYWLFY